MADRNGPFDLPKPMPPITPDQAQNDNQHVDKFTWARTLLDTSGLQQFRNDTARVWAPNGVQFVYPVMPHMANESGAEPTDGDDVSSQSSNSTVKMGVRHSDREPLDFDKADFVQALPSHKPSTDLSSPWNPTPNNARPRSYTSSSTDSDATFVTDHSLTQSVGSVDSTGCMSSQVTREKVPHRDRMVMLRSTMDANTCGTIKDLHIPDTPTSRQELDRLLSLRAIPSPLGQGRVKNEAISNSSSLLSVPPNTSDHQSQLHEHAAPQSPAIYGLHKRNVELDGKRSPFQKAAGFGFSHVRNPTDPFVEQAEKLQCGSRSSAQHPQGFHLRSPLAPKTPSLAANSQSLSSVAQVGDGLNPAVSNFTPVVRTELPIPPPPLPFAQHKYTHAPEARAALEAQKVVREAWIRSEAKKITELSRARFEAARQFEHTRSTGDYQALSRTEAEFLDSTNLEKRQEERRNMFLPPGMTAMRTGPGNIPSDGFAARGPPNQDAEGVGNGGNSAEGPGRFLGSQMAYMERVCAEVKRPDQGEGEVGEGVDKITADMLNMLSAEEKSALREHLVGRLRRATERRSCN
ncbi:hypothetical protein IAQ61_005985 [Plenodomus lingam]|uniref:Predicted protein n=1 Tax=Leptosphaeria maculans (strain JN3 / isolate v23.1.3 / race Av1-4-5-6-7-8) TaxID=985895 RepID=E4ZN32_LEPMJ|nr:predicted protein [Plenodomus lingam JN3]KAH9870509.1 hypothetical protein IAQ61_005985 [Plenodomus lingam]CBX92635.1 predicted protein [Plenodomus lingam JN3]